MNSEKLPHHDDKFLLAEKFKDFFVNKIDQIRNSFHTINNSPLVSYIPDFPLKGISCFREISKTEMIEIIKSINKTNCSIDPFNIRKMCEQSEDTVIESLAEIFVDIVNTSFASGVFPTSEKSAVVKPLLKASKDQDQLASYRPLFNTSILSKIHEKCCLLQLTEYLEKFEAIPKYQSAYKKMHSVETALCKIYNDLVKSKSSGQCTLLVLLDLTAAFDTVDQITLLEDLEHLGITGMALEWFRSYLVGRSFTVEIGDSSSGKAEMKTGLTQGTILSPICFSIYTMELYYLLASMGVSCHFYADDCQLLINVESQDQIQRDFNEIFRSILLWMKGRKLKLNAAKTECVFIGSNPLVSSGNFNSIQFDDQSELIFSDNVRDLGFIIDKNIDLKAQLQKTKGKSIGNLINISRIAKYLDRNSKIKLIHGLVFSHIDFCNALYAGLPDCMLRPLQTIINDSARMITGMPRFSREHITPICIDLHFLPIKARITYKICLLVYKALKHGQPAYIRSLLQWREPSRQLRGSSEPKLQEPIIARAGYSNRCFEYCAPRSFNALPVNIRSASNVEKFKTELKTYLFRQAYDLENKCLSSSYAV